MNIISLFSKMLSEHNFQIDDVQNKWTWNYFFFFLPNFQSRFILENIASTFHIYKVIMFLPIASKYVKCSSSKAIASQTQQINKKNKSLKTVTYSKWTSVGDTMQMSAAIQPNRNKWPPNYMGRKPIIHQLNWNRLLIGARS